MKKLNSLIIAAILMIMTVLAFTGCSVDSLKSIVMDGANILESAYFYDEDTGTYEAVCIIENKSEKPLKEGFLEAAALDKDGNRIVSVKEADEGGGTADNGFFMTYNWLSKGEKTAAIITNAGMDDNSIIDHYTEVPDSLEWAVAEGIEEKDSDLAPHGLSVKACEPNPERDMEYGEDENVYNVTLHNDSNTDYEFNENEFCYQADDTLFSFKVVAVYRNSEGEIKDIEQIECIGINTPAVIPAGSDVVMEGHSYNGCEDESLTPEYYLYIDFMYEE